MVRCVRIHVTRAHNLDTKYMWIREIPTQMRRHAAGTTNQNNNNLSRVSVCVSVYTYMRICMIRRPYSIIRCVIFGILFVFPVHNIYVNNDWHRVTYHMVDVCAYIANRVTTDKNDNTHLKCAQ